MIPIDHQRHASMKVSSRNSIAVPLALPHAAHGNRRDLSGSNAVGSWASGSASPGIGLLRAVVVLLLLIPNVATAQSSLLMGPIIGYEYSVPLSIDRTPGAINSYPNFDGTGESGNHSAMFGARLVIPNLPDDSWELAATLGLAISNGQFASDWFDGDQEFDPLNWKFITPRKRFDLDVSTGIARMDAAMGYRLGGLSLAAGLSLAYRLSSEFVYTEYSVAPNDSTSPISAPSRTNIVGADMGSNPFAFGLTASTAISIPMGASTTFRPELMTRVDPGALSDGLGIRAFSIGLGLSLLFQQTPTPAAEPPPEVASTPRHAPTNVLRASIDLYCSESDAVRSSRAAIGAERVMYHSSIPMLPRLFFDRDSTVLPLRYHKLTTAETDAFAVDSLAGLDAEALYRQVLNVIGLRLRNEPTARATLLGSVSSEEGIEIARARAETIRDYLIGVWGIDARRLRVETDSRLPGFADADPTQRSVRFVSDAPELTAPVVTRWVVENFSVPTIGIDPRIVADAGIREWSIAIRQGEREVANYSSMDEGEFEGIDLAFLLHEDRTDTTLPPLVAELTVEDSIGTIASASDTLFLFWSDTTRAGSTASTRESLENIHYLLLPSEQGEPTTVAALKGIVTTVRNGARITVSAPSGPDDRLMPGAARLAEQLLTSIRAQGTTVAEFHLRRTDRGTSRSIWEFPEQRAIGSGVGVTIEQSRPIDETNAP